MILPDRTIYLLHPTRTSARTVVVSLPTFPDTHQPLMTRANLPFSTNLRPRSSPFVLLPQPLSSPITPDLREIPIEYP